MDLRFVKTNPTGNTTILIESRVRIEDQAEIAGILMRDDFLSAEQVGFLGTPQNPSAAAASLRMMGGEFCGNAAMSLAAFLVWQDGGTEGEINVPLEVSGADGITECFIKRSGDDFQGTVKMPPPERIEELSLPLAGMERHLAAIRLPGITHVIVPLEIFGSAEEARKSAEQAAAKWEKLIEGEAFGILLHEREKNSITPLIRVKASGTTVWERGCGSGSAAIGAYLAGLSGADESARVTQPGGVIAVEARYEDGSVTGLSITGKVKIIARGMVYI
jgi:diaminopimelate epimerase